MTKRARLYIWGVILVGIILGPFAVYRYITGLGQVDLSLEIQQMVCLIALCALCRSQPIYINSHHAIDVSAIGILSTVLLKGPYAGVTVYLVSSLFTVDHDKETGQYHHIYNTPPTKTLFNLGNLVVSILLPGLLMDGRNRGRGGAARGYWTRPGLCGGHLCAQRRDFDDHVLPKRPADL